MAKSIDLVCGMSVDEEGSLKSTFGGRDYYFCSEECQRTFEKNPEQYVEPAA